MGCCERVVKKKKTIAQYEISEINSSVSSITSRTWHVYSCRQCIQRRHCTGLKMQMQTSLTTPSHDFWLEICTLQTPLVLSASTLQQQMLINNKEHEYNRYFSVLRSHTLLKTFSHMRQIFWMKEFVARMT